MPNVSMTNHTRAAEAFRPFRGIWLVARVLPVVACIACGDEDVKRSESVESKVTVNELQPRNSTIESDTGKKSDWVELFNPGATQENLDGYFVSDDQSDLTKGALGAEAVVPAGGFLLLWLDDTSDQPLHLPFKLSGDGDHFYLTDPSGRVIEATTLPPDPTGDDTSAPDVSYGALPDGSGVFNWCQTPTPGRPNAADCTPPADAAH